MTEKLVLSTTFAIAASHASAFDYVSPYGGFQYEYTAESGLLPDQASPAWTNGAYGSDKAYLTLDGLAGESVLLLNHTIGNDFSNYTMHGSAGAGTTEDLITMDFRFRLLDTQPGAQLSLTVSRPPTSFQSANGSQGQVYHLRLGNNAVTTMRGSGSTFTNTATSLGTDWHDARLTIDVAMGRAKLYLDGSVTPAVAWRGASVAAVSPNTIAFGDGTNGVSGRAEVSYLKWSTNSLSIPMENGTGIPGNPDARRGLEILEHRNILTTTERTAHLNFPFVSRFDDGVMHMFYSQGQHNTPGGVPEVSHTMYSTDDGLTWAPTPAGLGVSPSNVHQFALGTGPLNSQGTEMRIVSTHINSGSTATDRHIVYVNRWTDPLLPREALPGGSGRFVDFPFVTTAFAHRTMIELENGTLLQTLYGTAAGDTKMRSMLIQSTDQGNSWSYLSTIAYQSNLHEGFNEPTIVQLADGSLLAMMRSGTKASSRMYQAKSTDGGATWTDLSTISEPFGNVDPHVIRLENGALVAASGRSNGGFKGVYLMVDYTGTGDHWQSVELLSTDHFSSGYTTLIEIEPNKVMAFYNWSGFMNNNLPNAELPNRLMVTTFMVHTPEPAFGLAAAGALLLLGRRQRRTRPN